MAQETLALMKPDTLTGGYNTGELGVREDNKMRILTPHSHKVLNLKPPLLQIFSKLEHIFPLFCLAFFFSFLLYTDPSIAFIFYN